MFPYDRKGVTLFLVTLLTVETISRLAPISLSISNNIKTEEQEQDQEDVLCRTTKTGAPDSWAKDFELPCIFPFYYKDKLYNECALLDIDDYNTPVYRCPIFNTTKKKNGINHFEEDYRDNQELFGMRKYCLDQTLAKATCGNNLEEELWKLPKSPCNLTLVNSEIGAGLSCHDDAKVSPFATCKSDCPGVKGFGVIGGGAVLLTTTSAVGASPWLPAIGSGLAGFIGWLGARNTCNYLYCRTERSQQCCLRVLTMEGLKCPDFC